MTFSRQQIEAITQGVLRELSSRGIPLAAQPAASSSQLTPPVSGPADNSTTQTLTHAEQKSGPIEFHNKVITEAALITAGAAGKTIVIPPTAIITPSGRDYIRHNSIVITSSVSPRQSTEGGLVVITGSAASAISAAGAAKWKTLTAGCERDAVRRIRQQSNQRIVCCGGEASAIACLLNRDVSIRAAVVTHTTDLENLIAMMNPQVFCLDSAWSFAALLKLLRTLQQGGSDTPAEWKE